MLPIYLNGLYSQSQENMINDLTRFIYDVQLRKKEQEDCHGIYIRCRRR